MAQAVLVRRSKARARCENSAMASDLQFACQNEGLALHQSLEKKVIDVGRALAFCTMVAVTVQCLVAFEFEKNEQQQKVTINIAILISMLACGLLAVYDPRVHCALCSCIN